LGYYEEESVFFVNAIDKSLGSTGVPPAYQDIDISDDIEEVLDVSGQPVSPMSISAMFQIVFSANLRHYAFRNNGSTDDLYQESQYRNVWGYIIGVDENNICEAKIESTEVDFYLTGWQHPTIYVFNSNEVYYVVNAIDLNITEDDAWHHITDISAAGFPWDDCGGGIMVDIQNVKDAGWTVWGLKPHELNSGIYPYPSKRASYKHLWAMMGAKDGIVEAITASVFSGGIWVFSASDFYLLGSYKSIDFGEPTTIRLPIISSEGIHVPNNRIIRG
jgi:hypothetical protein